MRSGRRGIEPEAEKSGMATVRLRVKRRTAVGKQAAKRLRAAGAIPAVLYGEAEGNVPLTIDGHDFRTALSTPAGRNVILQLSMDGEERITRAVVREMDRDPVSRQIIHVDLQRISENRPVVMHVPVVLVGESPAVKEGRGILDHTMRQLEVRCLPANIPEQVEVDISTLEARHAIRVGDISIPDVEILDNPERPVVEVLQPTIYREAVEAAAAAAVEAAAEAEEGEAAAGEKEPPSDAEAKDQEE